MACGAPVCWSKYTTLPKSVFPVQYTLAYSWWSDINPCLNSELCTFVKNMDHHKWSEMSPTDGTTFKKLPWRIKRFLKNKKLIISLSLSPLSLSLTHTYTHTHTHTLPRYHISPLLKRRQNV